MSTSKSTIRILSGELMIVHEDGSIDWFEPKTMLGDKTSIELEYYHGSIWIIEQSGETKTYRERVDDLRFLPFLREKHKYKIEERIRLWGEFDL